jgi:crossover junction endodeoxyribonuclease RuvC
MSLNKRVILGVDPGFGVTGYAILKQDEAGKVFLLDFGYLQLKPKEHLSVRVGIFYDHFYEKIKTHSVTNIAIETPFLGKNAQVFLKLGYLRGILYLLANQNTCELHEFSPREVKVSVTGFGGATKDQVATMILRLFPRINEIVKIAKNDVTDALAVSICGLWYLRRRY